MTKFCFLFIILTSVFHKLLMAEHNCPVEYPDCFNCTTCGETEVNYLECLCQWDSAAQSCKRVNPKSSIYYFFQAFSSCIDTSSISIQETYCGTSSITLDKDFTFTMPKIHDVYGTRSVYCEYQFITSEKEDYYYNIDYKFNSNYTSEQLSVNLYLIVKYNDYTSSTGLLEVKEINKDFHFVKEIILILYFEHSFPSLPFSLVITRKKDNSKITLYITIGIILVSCIICALAIYCLSKKISENARLRQRALFEIAMAHQNGVDNDDDEYEEQRKIETENKLKIQFALKHSLKAKRFLKKYGTKDGNTCTICIEDFKEKISKVSITPCKHVFHYQCLSNWLIKNIINPKCPNCNYNLIQDVKDSDIQPTVVNPQRINVNSIRIHNIEGENITTTNNNINNENRENTQAGVNSRNITVEANTNANTNTEERNLRTSINQIDNRRNN